MLSRNIHFFAAAFLLLVAAYLVGFNVTVRVDPTAAEARYHVLSAADRPRAAAAYGRRVVDLRRKHGESSASLAPFIADQALTEIAARQYGEAADNLTTALAAPWGDSLAPLERANYEESLARAHMLSGELARGVRIYADFLAQSGDLGAGGHAGHDHGDTTVVSGAHLLEDAYAASLRRAETLFAETFAPLGAADAFSGGRAEQLVAASDMTALGAFYAASDPGMYAAAGLLASAYELRRASLGGHHPDTVQVAVMLGPVYRRLGRLKDAERLYLEAFHAQEKEKGPNNPDLSLYLRLLAGVYVEQGRATEAQALYVHMRDLFRDAFGDQRYAANRARDRKLDVDRPVSQYFVLPDTYRPADLIAAAKYSIPLSKNSGLDEMKLRLAADPDGESREDNLPVRLAQLISLCRAETGERLSLRSGYRSYQTQKALFRRLGHLGTVTPPGMSEHQTGLAADIDVDGRLMRQSDKTYRCFEENAYRFGFILSYPQGNDYLPGDDPFEPWHWRYVGVRTARLYREAGPMNKPQEFLAALECYQERAAAGAFTIAGETDVCLDAGGPELAATPEAPDRNDATGPGASPKIVSPAPPRMRSAATR